MRGVRGVRGVSVGVRIVEALPSKTKVRPPDEQSAVGTADFVARDFNP